jgi:sugar phosphate isomerase/epimerase
VRVLFPHFKNCTTYRYVRYLALYVALCKDEVEVYLLPSSHPVIRVALYARVSTLAGQDPEMQLRELREYCERRRLQIVEEYVDKGVSGSRERRPALDRLRAVCRKRLVDTLDIYAQFVPESQRRAVEQTSKMATERIAHAHAVRAASATGLPN